MPASGPASSHPPNRSPNQAAERRSTPEPPAAPGPRPRSPPSLNATGRVRVPAKRARKAINCGPCRQSKLKCDRERPCSPCKLRGTAASCTYQNQDGESLAVSRTEVSRTDVPIDARNVNAGIELSKIRQGLALIESHIDYLQGLPTLSGSIPPHQPSPGAPGPSQLKESLLDSDLSEPEAAPGVRGQSSRSGLYAGPTSTLAHLTPGGDSNVAPEAAENTLEPTPDVLPPYDSDHDLRKALPRVSVIDGLVDFYFEYCNWLYRFVNHRTFMAGWARYKSGAAADRTVLATMCMIMAVTVHILPADHELLRSLAPDIEELGAHYYSIMRLALQRKQTESRTYSVELVELLLIRCHYFLVTKTDGEEAWQVKGELITIGMAMGLHRDPGRQMPLAVAERRRWAWWNILTIERWQAFMFGRPVSIASHHFDTRLPSYCDPQVDPSGRLYVANIHVFRLAFILGNIMDDAVSLRPVPYESVLQKDRTLQEWWDTRPTELDADDYALVSLLASSTTSKQRKGVLSALARAAFLHIRFAMHRPYASLARGEKSKYATSLDIAIKAADKLIVLAELARPQMLSHSLPAPGHLAWVPIHCFSAAMFFCFQIINNPEQLQARLLRGSVLRALATLESCRGSEKALDILRALSPLYAEEFISDTPVNREHKKQAVLPSVRRLKFPCVDSPKVPIGASESGSSPALSSAHVDSPGPGPDRTQPPPHPSVQGTTIHRQEAEMISVPRQVLQPQHPASENLSSLRWTPTDLAVNDPAQYPVQYLAQGQQDQQYQNAALPHQPADNEEVMWRYAPQYAPAATLVHPEAAAAAASSPSRDLYVQQQHQMIQQDPYAQAGMGIGAGGAVDGQMGLGVGMEGEMWDAMSGIVPGEMWGAVNGFVPSEWERMYTGWGTLDG